VRREQGAERPRAVSEYLVERLARAGATKLCFVISPAKSDILRYYGASVEGMDVAYVVQPQAAGLCDALFRARHLVGPDEPVAIGLPDTIWFPEGALGALPTDRLAFLLFPVERPQAFDAVVTDESGRVVEIQVKAPEPATSWVWGALRAPGRVYHALAALWDEREREDEYLGTLINAWIAQGGDAVGVKGGQSYVDVGTVDGYRAALRLLTPESPDAAEARTDMLEVR
jgi:glucose-1-phosphate thymidylyltransferase